MTHEVINTEEFSYGRLIPRFSFVRAQTAHSISRKEHSGGPKNNNQLRSKSRNAINSNA